MNKFDYSDWYCLILHEISRKKIENFHERTDLHFSKQKPSFQRTFVWNSGSRFACQQMEDFDQK